MIRRRVVCPCSLLSPALTDEQRRALGWRLVPASACIESTPQLAHGDVFVWACPDCAGNRRVQLATG